MQGNCTEPPTTTGSDDAALAAVVSGQCLLIVRTMLARMPFDGDLWLHNLHVRVVRASEDKRNLIALLQPTSLDHRLYLTSITVQGDAPDGQVRGLSVQDGARVYVEGTSINCRTCALRTSRAVSKCRTSCHPLASVCQYCVYEVLSVPRTPCRKRVRDAAILQCPFRARSLDIG